MAATGYNAAEMVAVDEPIETEGANDPWQLAQLERAFQRRQVRALCALGVRFADPARVDIRGEVTAEQEGEIDVDGVFAGRVDGKSREEGRSGSGRVESGGRRTNKKTK